MAGEVELSAIRPFSREDGEAETFVRMWRSSMQATHSFLTPPDLDYSESRLREHLSSTNTQVAETAEDGPVGFLVHTGSHIEALVVDLRVRGKGLRKIFLDWLAEQYDVLTIDVYEQDDALECYRRYGFEQTDRSPVDREGRILPLLHLRKDIDFDIAE